jgi:integrase/recombinase XerC
MPQTPLTPRRTRPAPPLPEKPTKPLWDICVDRFLLSCRAKDLSINTIKLYTSCLTGERTTTFRQDHGIDRPSAFTGELLQTFELELRDAGMEASSVGTYHKTVKRFAYWCDTHGYDIDRSVLGVEAPRKEQKRPEVYTDAEVKKLMAAAVCPRDRVIIELFYRTGLRLDELISLDVDDIVNAPEGVYLHVRRGKGRKQRIVPLDSATHRMSKVLTNYLVKIRPQSEYSALFLNRSRRPMGAEAVKRLLARLGEKCGIHAHAHKFRHTFATQAIRDGVDVLTLQRVLGHATLGMVSHYVQYDAGSLTAAWAKRGAA